MWMKSRWFQKLGGGRLERAGLRAWSRLQFTALNGRKDKETVDLLWKIHRDGRSLLSAFEAYLVFAAARAQAKQPGDYAEVGVYKGASAKLICEAKGDKKLRLFDTYEGLPSQSANDPGVHREQQYACTLESVREYLNGYSNIEFYKGIFPESAKGVPEARYAFAHFDVDLYEGTLGCLEYFYPRMIPGGIMLSHDYGLLSGVQKAFDEFFADKPEGIIEQPTTQCMVIKLPER
jgi:O-methyltransferase